MIIRENNLPLEKTPVKEIHDDFTRKYSAKIDSVYFT